MVLFAEGPLEQRSSNIGIPVYIRWFSVLLLNMSPYELKHQYWVGLKLQITTVKLAVVVVVVFTTVDAEQYSLDLVCTGKVFCWWRSSQRERKLLSNRRQKTSNQKLRREWGRFLAINVTLHKRSPTAVAREIDMFSRDVALCEWGGDQKCRFGMAFVSLQRRQPATSSYWTIV